MDSKTIKIRKGNAKTFTFLTDSKEDKVDMCVYEDGEKLCTIKATSPIEKDGEWQYTVRLPEDVSEELGEGDLEYELRTNGEPFEEGTLSLYSKKNKNEGEAEKD